MISSELQQWMMDLRLGTIGVSDYLDFQLELYEMLSRQTGRTRRRIESLRDGDMYVSYSRAGARDAERYFAELQEVRCTSWKRVRFVVATTIGELGKVAALAERKVVLDNHVEFLIYKNVIAEMKSLIMSMHHPDQGEKSSGGAEKAEAVR